MRAAATIGGHLALFRAKHLQSNLVPVLMALSAQVGIATLSGTRFALFFHTRIGALCALGALGVLFLGGVPKSPRSQYQSHVSRSRLG